MATYKSTKKLYPKEYIDGRIYYHNISPISLSLIAETDKLPHFNELAFFTEAAKKYLSGQITYAWCKCHISDTACESIIKNSPLADAIEHYALITHDKDVDVLPHTHMLIKFYRNAWVSPTLVEYFQVDNVSNAGNDLSNRINYLTHNSDACRKQGKYQYNESEIVSDDWDWWKRRLAPVDDKDDDYIPIVSELLDGVPYRQLAKKFGREFIIHHKAYREMANIIFSEENRWDKFTIENVGEGFIGLYNKETGNIVEVARTLDELKKAVLL